MENDKLDYPAETALDDAAVMKVRVAQQTHTSLPWWMLAAMATTWPLLAVSFAVGGWAGYALPLLVISINMAAVVALSRQAERTGMWGGLTLDVRKTPWPYVGLGLIGLGSLAMMPLTDINDWPTWYAIAVGVVAGVLTVLLTLWVDRRATAELARATSRLKETQ